ncbi:MAG: hypothetical protein FJZ90_13505 [Chloroflexi bacterium]|nr:hypothetical protein [Chloroflexota bacterium]
MTNCQPASLQMFPWATCVAAVQDSARYPDFAAFYADLPYVLPQNSPETRRRTASLIARWYFPSRSLDSLPSLVWRAYRREDILVDIMRVMTLEAEPVVARFVVERVQPLPIGAEFGVSLARDYISTVYGRFVPKSYERLLTTARHLGFLGGKGERWHVTAHRRADNAFLLLLHDRFAPTPRIVRIADILASPFWKYLGLRSEDDVRSILRDAEAAQRIARYAKVDELEQVTTLYSAEEYVGRALTL